MSSIKIKGGIRRIWTLNDFSKPQDSYKYLSRKSLLEFNCETEEYRYLSNIIFRKKMGSGEVINIPDPEGSWQYISPESRGELLYKLLCDQK